MLPVNVEDSYDIEAGISFLGSGKEALFLLELVCETYKGYEFFTCSVMK